MAASVIFTGYDPRDIKSSSGGQQSCDTAEAQLSAPATSQALSQEGLSPTTPTQQAIFQDFSYWLHRRLTDLKKQLNRHYSF